MALLALLIALFVEHYYHKDTGDKRSKVSHRNWFERYQSALGQWFGEQSWFKGWLSEMLLIAAPALLVYWVYSWYQHDLWYHGSLLGSLMLLALAVVVLVVCLGPESPRKSLKRYFKARAEHDDQTAFEAAVEFTGQESAADIGELDKQVARAVFATTQTRYFAVVLWFMILGPAGALLYRLSNWYLARNEGSDVSQKLGFILEWIPARISALAYLLAGDMSTGVAKVKSGFLNLEVAGLAFVQEAGEASLGFYEADDQRGPSRWALKLSERAGVIIFALVAVMSMLGWGLY